MIIFITVVFCFVYKKKIPNSPPIVSTGTEDKLARVDWGKNEPN